MSNDEPADTIQYRRKNKIKGIRGTDWWCYRNGVPPEDDNDYVWNVAGQCWEIDDK